MMTFVRPFVLAIAVGTVFAFGACEKQPYSTIESIEKTMFHHGEDHGDSHGSKESHGEKSDKAGQAESAKH